MTRQRFRRSLVIFYTLTIGCAVVLTASLVIGKIKGTLTVLTFPADMLAIAGTIGLIVMLLLGLQVDHRSLSEPRRDTD